MSEIKIDIKTEEEPEMKIQVYETVPVGKYEELSNKRQSLSEVENLEKDYLSAGAVKKLFESIGSDVFVVHGKIYQDVDTLELIIVNFDCDEKEIIKQYNAGKLILLEIAYHSLYVFGFLKELSESGGYVVFVVNNGAGMNHRFICDMGTWKIEKIQDNGGGSVDLSNYYTKEEVNDYFADCVKNTDYASTTAPGIVKLRTNSGLSIVEDCALVVDGARHKDIENKLSLVKAITPATFDYAVKFSTHQDLSDEYKPESLETSIGYVDNADTLPVSYRATKNYVDNKIGDVETALDNIISEYGLGGDEL